MKKKSIIHSSCVRKKMNVILLKMKLLTILVFTGSMVFSANTYSQRTKIDLQLKNSSLTEILSSIEKKSEFIFIYNKEVVDFDEKKSISVRDENIETVLDLLFLNTGITYRIDDRQVFLYKDNEAETIPRGETEEVIQPKKLEITGKVFDSKGVPIPGVTVIVKSTLIGTITNFDGTFSLSIPADSGTLRFSFVGMLTQEIPISGKSSIKVVMEEESIGIEEVVAVGYSTQTKITVTGSISAIKQEELQAISTPTLGEGILGKVAGISMTQSSGTPGESDPSVYIRGIGTFNSTEPLFIIDGVPNNKRAFMQLNPASIRDISILKDASATAVYGVKGANGVIIVTTRRGSVGKTQIDAQLSYGLQEPFNMLELANSYQYAIAYNQMLKNDGKTTGFMSDEHIEHYRTHDQPLLYPDKNWVEEVLNHLAPQMRGNVNLSGGTDKVQYFTSVGYFSQEGLLKQYGPSMENFGYNRLNLQTNIDVNITPTTRLSFTGNTRAGSRKEPLPVTTITMGTLWSRLYGVPPMTSYGEYEGKFVNPDMRYLPESISFIEESFPQYLWHGDARKVEENRYDLNFDFTQQMKGIWKGLDGLKFRAKIGYRSGFDRNKAIIGDMLAIYTAILNKDAINPNPNIDPNEVVFKKASENGTKSWRTWYNPARYMYFETGFDYEKNIGKHYLSGLILYNQNKDYFPTGVGYSDIPIGNVGLVGRVNWNYNQQYMLEVNVGYNGSENFARDQRFGLFPSISGGWVISKEKFMQNISFINELKLRFSYGIVGSDQAGGTSRFTYIGTSYNRNISQYYGYNFGNDIPQFRPGVLEQAVGNTGITWETAKKQNYGIDMELFNHFNLSFDYFYEYRDDILMSPRSTPNFVGFSMPALNIGRVRNQGIDITAGWTGKHDDFSYSFDGNFTYSKNVILFMDEIPPAEPYQTVSGHSLNYFYGYVWEGFYTEEEVAIINQELENGIDPSERTISVPTAAFVKPGDNKYTDLNQDGIVNDLDTKVIENPSNPGILVGLNGRLSWKKFDLNFGFQGVSKVSRQLWSTQPFGLQNRNSLWLPFAEASWTPERAAAGTVEWPRLTSDNKGYNAFTSTFWVRDASYLRLKRAELGYTFSNVPVVKYLRVYISGTNLFTLQKHEFRWTDPELSGQTYPLVKLYSVGLDVTF